MIGTKGAGQKSIELSNIHMQKKQLELNSIASCIMLSGTYRCCTVVQVYHHEAQSRLKVLRIIGHTEQP